MDKEKSLKLMRFWLFGTFVIIYAAATVYVGQFTGLLILKTWEYWASMGITALLCIGAFYLYSWYLDRK